VNVFGEARNVTSVPVLPSEGPVSRKGASATPSVNDISNALPARQTRSFSQVDSAFTTETPTPCRPPETL
jgi:hypothetical protein